MAKFCAWWPNFNRIKILTGFDLIPTNIFNRFLFTPILKFFEVFAKDDHGENSEYVSLQSMLTIILWSVDMGVRQERNKY